MKTIIAIQARGSGSIEDPQPYNRKKNPMTVDKDRLQKLSDQLAALVEELDDIREDLEEMSSDIEASFYEDRTESEEELLESNGRDQRNGQQCL